MSAARLRRAGTKERRLRREEPRMKRISRVGMKREAVIDPSLEKTLLSLHAAMDVGSFWKAIQQLLAAAIPNRLIGLMLQPNPILPMITRWTLRMPDGFFTAEPLKSYIAAQPRQRFVRISDLFSNPSGLMKSAFYRRYMAPQKCAFGVCLLFCKNQRLICVIAIMRTATQGDFSPAEVRLLEREHSLRMDLEDFLSRLPMPTILLRWNLKPIYQNRAARDFCALWEKGPDEAHLMNATSPIPSEILDRCRLLKQQWAHAQPRMRSGPLTGFKEERVHHPRSPHLRATIRLKQLSSCGVARPHFLIECEDVRSSTGAHTGST